MVGPLLAAGSRTFLLATVSQARFIRSVAIHIRPEAPGTVRGRPLHSAITLKLKKMIRFDLI